MATVSSETIATDFAWAAGFFDGEGCSYVMKVKQRKYPRLRLCQVDSRPLTRFVEIIDIGKIRGPYPPTGNQRAAQSEWGVAGKKAQLVMDLLWDHLSEPKKEQYTRVVLECQG